MGGHETHWPVEHDHRPQPTDVNESQYPRGSAQKSVLMQAVEGGGASERERSALT